MGYTTDNKQEAVVESVLLTTEKTFVAPTGADRSDCSQTSEVVYFQIED
ncbi:hypothetical protein [Polynucleobacter sp. MWH-HuK1]|nr:hypothetical protein [Polynucleobacter sp. MWH-HuK1]MBU3566393.1 hypothetical protein [Polynucleobacter sp. MWH-HuK1]